MKLGKPQSKICSKCFIKNNILRCMTCNHKTKEWITKCKAVSPIMLLGEHDNFKEKEKIKTMDKNLAIKKLKCIKKDLKDKNQLKAIEFAIETLQNISDLEILKNASECISLSTNIPFLDVYDRLKKYNKKGR